MAAARKKEEDWADFFWPGKSGAYWYSGGTTQNHGHYCQGSRKRSPRRKIPPSLSSHSAAFSPLPLPWCCTKGTKEKHLLLPSLRGAFPKRGPPSVIDNIAKAEEVRGREAKAKKRRSQVSPLSSFPLPHSWSTIIRRKEGPPHRDWQAVSFVEGRRPVGRSTTTTMDDLGPRRQLRLAWNDQ